MAKQEIDGVMRSELRRMHKVLEGVVINDAFIAAAADAHNNVSSLSELKAKAKAYFAGRRPSIPDEIDMELVGETSPALRLSVEGESLRAGIELSCPKTKPVSTKRDAVAGFKNMVRAGSRAVVSNEVLDVVGEASADKAARKEFKADPKAYLKGKGVSVPDEVTLDVTETANPHIPFMCFSYKYCDWKGQCTDIWFCFPVPPEFGH